MTAEQKDALLIAGELIASKKDNMICICLIQTTGITLSEISEAQLINPGTAIWWGYNTMGIRYHSPEARAARLIGIAMMLTMPKEILEGKCHKK